MGHTEQCHCSPGAPRLAQCLGTGHIRHLESFNCQETQIQRQRDRLMARENMSVSDDSSTKPEGWAVRRQKCNSETAQKLLTTEDSTVGPRGTPTTPDLHSDLPVEDNHPHGSEWFDSITKKITSCTTILFFYWWSTRRMRCNIYWMYWNIGRSLTGTFLKTYYYYYGTAILQWSNCNVI